MRYLKLTFFVTVLTVLIALLGCTDEGTVTPDSGNNNNRVDPYWAYCTCTVTFSGHSPAPISGVLRWYHGTDPDDSGTWTLKSYYDWKAGKSLPISDTFNFNHSGSGYIIAQAENLSEPNDYATYSTKWVIELPEQSSTENDSVNFLMDT